jgi:hypothetical protein
MTYRE